MTQHWQRHTWSPETVLHGTEPGRVRRKDRLTVEQCVVPEQEEVPHEWWDDGTTDTVSSTVSPGIFATTQSLHERIQTVPVPFKWTSGTGQSHLWQEQNQHSGCFWGRWGQDRMERDTKAPSWGDGRALHLDRGLSLHRRMCLSKLVTRYT